MSAGKVLASVFWDMHAILFIHCLEKGRTINSEYYMALLVSLMEEITKKTTPNEEKKCFFTKPMHRVTSPSQQWQNCTNCPLNCFPNHLKPKKNALVLRMSLKKASYKYLQHFFSLVSNGFDMKII